MMAKVVALLGPTGVGKTELAIHLGRTLGGEIVSVDSRLLYRGMDIGTAKPTATQRAAVPHHLIDVADPDEVWSLGRFRQAVLEIVDGISRSGSLPILAGGTGQYMTAVLDGWAPPPKPADDEIRRRWEGFAAENGAAALHRRLAEVDPEAAGRIDYRNVRRVVRALEVVEWSGGPRRDQPIQVPAPFEAVRVGLRLPRSELYARLDARLDRMLADGFVDEVRRLLARGYGRDLPSMSAIGYRQLAAYLEDEMAFEQAVARIRQATRRFVRHQSNWFRSDDPRIRWFEPRPGYEAEVVAYVTSALGAS
ncbi:MAG TPA: tRNA (adenosine(37)-N6)-dimethylallyltransferase MiaA [Anaerolineales bacterium]|nr:tRNA (adenosine(37)-N6)-dimethylallyltransferase MiaA [Anaerolineales bacterium]